MPRRTLPAIAGLSLSLALFLALAACDDGDGDGAAPSGPDCASPSGVSQDDWFAYCAPGGTPTAGPANTAPVGGWVAMPNGVAVSVARVEPAPAAETTPPGFTPALVTLTVTNRSTTPYDVSGVDIREMGRVDGTRAERITHSQLPQQDLTGTLPPGQTAMAQQLFNVPDALRPGFRIVVAMTPAPSALPDATFTGTLTTPPTSTP